MKSPKERVQEYVREQIPDLRELIPLETFVVYQNELCLFLQECIGGLRLLNCYNDEGSMVYTILKELADPNKCTIIGKEITLHHYLTVLGDSYAVDGGGYLLSFVDGEWTNVSNGNGLMQFSLTDGQPVTEKDWEIMSNLLKV